MYCEGVKGLNEEIDENWNNEVALRKKEKEIEDLKKSYEEVANFVQTIAQNPVIEEIAKGFQKHQSTALGSEGGSALSQPKQPLTPLEGLEKLKEDLERDFVQKHIFWGKRYGPETGESLNNPYPKGTFDLAKQQWDKKPMPKEWIPEKAKNLSPGKGGLKLFVFKKGGAGSQFDITVHKTGKEGNHQNDAYYICHCYESIH
jgi:hypothetical protein